MTKPNEPGYERKRPSWATTDSVTTTFSSIKLAQQQSFNEGWMAALLEVERRIENEYEDLAIHAKKPTNAEWLAKDYLMRLFGTWTAWQIVRRLATERIPDHVDPAYLPGGDSDDV